MSNDIDLIDYVVTEYKYVPTIPIIMKVTPWKFAVGLLNHFYPELAKFQFVSDVIKPEQKDDTDSEDEKSIKKTNKKTVVPKKQKKESDSEDEKPVKTTKKKTIVPKKQKESDSKNDKPVKKTKKGNK